MRYQTTGSPPHNGKGRNTLTVRDPRLNSILAGWIDDLDIAETSQIGNWCLREIDTWARQKRGVTQYRFQQEQPNRLANGYRRDGAR